MTKTKAISRSHAISLVALRSEKHRKKRWRSFSTLSRLGSLLHRLLEIQFPNPQNQLLIRFRAVGEKSMDAMIEIRGQYLMIDLHAITLLAVVLTVFLIGAVVAGKLSKDRIR